MKNNTKKWILIAVTCVTVGLVLCVIGNLCGAKNQIVINGSGFHAEEGTDFEYEAQNTVKKVTVDVSDAKVLVEGSDDEKVKVKLQNIQNGNNIKVSDQNGEFKVKEEGKLGFNIWLGGFLNLFNGNNERIVTVYLPKDVQLSELSLSTNNGRIESYSRLKLDKLNLESSNGRICVSNIQVNENSYIHTSNGGIELDGEFNGLSDIKTSNGEIDAKGTYLGNTRFKSSNGKIDLETSAKKTDYNVKAHTSNGSVYINGEKKSNDIEISADTSNTLDIDTSNGKIEMEFED